MNIFVINLIGDPTLISLVFGIIFYLVVQKT